MKHCPYCAEEIKDEAVKCKHCGARQPNSSAFSNIVDTLDAANTISADQIGPGNILAGRYAIVERLGSGGMGEVFKATDSEMNNMPVAIKVLPPLLARNAKSIEALKHEAYIALKLTHQNICRLYNFVSDGELKFLVMEYIEGQTLENLLEKKADHKMSWEELRPIAIQIASALDYAHSSQPPILHRDIKPSNVMLTKNGLAKLLDFGIAREMRDFLTRITGHETSGTLLYMSPEQFRGEKIDLTSDIYSFCLVLYEALMGIPFVSPGGSMNWQILEKPFQKSEQLPEEVNSLLEAGLAKSRIERPVMLQSLFHSQAERKEAAVIKPKPQVSTRKPPEKNWYPLISYVGKPKGKVATEQKHFHVNNAKPPNYPGTAYFICFLGVLQMFPVFGWLCVVVISPLILEWLSIELLVHRKRRLMSQVFENIPFNSDIGQKIVEVFKIRKVSTSKRLLWWCLFILLVGGYIFNFVFGVAEGAFQRYDVHTQQYEWTYNEPERNFEHIFELNGNDAIQIAGGLLYFVFLPSYLVWLIVRTFLFYRDLLRHRRAEILAYAFLEDKPDLYNELVLKTEIGWNGFWRKIRNIIFILTWPAIFPFVMSHHLAEHFKWEVKSGIAEAFGEVRHLKK